MKVRIIRKTTNNLPAYETPQSAGMDLRADLWEIKEKFLVASYVNRNEKNEITSLVISPGGRALIPTGLYIALPSGYEAQVRPRSGLALKQGITVLNSPGTIDADYRGEIGIILINHGQEAFEVKQGDRVAQLVIAKYEQAEFEEVESLDETKRGEGGFGHTNV